MSFLGEVAGGPNTPLVFLAFLQETGCGNSDFQQELDSLDRDLKRPRDLGDIHGDDGELQTDGHFCSNNCEALLRDMRPELEPSMNPVEAVALRGVAVGLMEIADQLERDVIARGADHLTARLQDSPFRHWMSHLTQEVEWVLKQGLGRVLEQLPQERVVVAVTLSLVKGVCEQAPRLLRNLFTTALQYINPAAS